MSTTFSDQFRSFGGRELQLDIIEYNRDSFEVQVLNKNYTDEKNFRIKTLATLVIVYCAYIVSLPSRLLVVDTISLIILLFLLYSTLDLVKSEKVLFISEFALQIITERGLSRKSTLFIPTANVQDVVINEVIEDLAIKHVLIIRTKGNLCHTRPIIIIFRCLQPRIECLEIIYSHFLKKLDPIR